jgi:Limiting CO2-inducible proteins B/C beta carbonyic anhydrases
MGGLAGFPFGGITSFGAMAHHIPDGGNCLVVYGPHVGVDQLGSVGKIDRRGRSKPGACCGSAAAALGKLRKGAMVPAGAAGPPPPTDSLDAQQEFVDASLLPFGERLLNADDRNVDLPYVLYEAQKKMMEGIVAKGASAVADGAQIAVLGGIQINTPDGLSDYFLPLSFELRDKSGQVVKDFMATA